MKKKKPWEPKTMDDLEKIYYGPNKDGKKVSSNLINNNGNRLRTHIITPSQEREIKEIFSILGEVKRISEKKTEQTSDYKIDTEKLLIEVTSMNITLKRDNVDSTPPLNLPRDEKKLIERINRPIEHIESKEDSECPNYSRCGVIFYDDLFMSFTEIGKLLRDTEFISKTNFPQSKIDTLLFITDPESINGKSSRGLYPPIFYIKNKKIFEKFSQKFSNFKVIDVTNIKKKISMESLK